MTKQLKPKDYERLRALLYRVDTLRRCNVKFQPDQVEALKRVVAILRPPPEVHDEPPPGFGQIIVAPAESR
jgi:hypothetical protein